MSLLQTLTIVAAGAALAASGTTSVTTTGTTDYSHTGSTPLSAVAEKHTVKGSFDLPDDFSGPMVAQLLKYNRQVAKNGGGQGMSSGLGDGSIDYAQDRGSERWIEVAKTKVNTDGSFEFKNIDDGSYKIQFGDPAKTQWAMKMARVNGKDLDVGDIDLQAPEGKQGSTRGKMGDDDGDGNGRR